MLLRIASSMRLSTRRSRCSALVGPIAFVASAYTPHKSIVDPQATTTLTGSTPPPPQSQETRLAVFQPTPPSQNVPSDWKGKMLAAINLFEEILDEVPTPSSPHSRERRSSSSTSPSPCTKVSRERKSSTTSSPRTKGFWARIFSSNMPPSQCSSVSRTKGFWAKIFSSNMPPSQCSIVSTMKLPELVSNEALRNKTLREEASRATTLRTECQEMASLDKKALDEDLRNFMEFAKECRDASKTNYESLYSEQSIARCIEQWLNLLSYRPGRASQILAEVTWLSNEWKNAPSKGDKTAVRAPTRGDFSGLVPLEKEASKTYLGRCSSLTGNNSINSMAEQQGISDSSFRVDQRLLNVTFDQALKFFDVCVKHGPIDVSVRRLIIALALCGAEKCKPTAAGSKTVETAALLCLKKELFNVISLVLQDAQGIICRPAVYQRAIDVLNGVREILGTTSQLGTAYDIISALLQSSESLCGNLEKISKTMYPSCCHSDNVNHEFLADTLDAARHLQEMCVKGSALEASVGRIIKALESKAPNKRRVTVYVADFIGLFLRLFLEKDRYFGLSAYTAAVRFLTSVGKLLRVKESLQPLIDDVSKLEKTVQQIEATSTNIRRLF